MKKLLIMKPALTYSKSTIETPEQCEICLKLSIKTYIQGRGFVLKSITFSFKFNQKTTSSSTEIIWNIQFQLYRSYNLCHWFCRCLPRLLAMGTYFVKQFFCILLCYLMKCFLWSLRSREWKALVFTLKIVLVVTDWRM